MKKALVIGSGVAGLAVALRLRRKNYHVEVFESNSYVGGKIHNLEIDGYRFDTGPSLFTLPELVDELFSLFGELHSDFFTYQKKDRICNYFWEDGTRFSALADRDEFVKQASQTFHVDPEELENYLNRAREKYDLTSHIFLEKSLHKVSSYFSLDVLKSLLNMWKLDINTSLHAYNDSSFDDPRLVQFFDRFATYNGSSPYKTPGIMSMIPHLEMDLGTYLPKGGMQSISQSLYDFAVKQGVKFHTSTSVTEILTKGSDVSGIVAGGQQIEGDIVISNSDVFSSYTNLLKDKLPPKKIINQERSSSAIIFYWGIRKEFPELDLHNIFFSHKYKEEFKAIFEDQTLIDDPTVYVNITSKQEQNDAPKGCENWFVMINAPGNFGQDWDQMIVESRKNIIDKLSRILKIDLENLIECEEILEPRTIESKTSSHRGSLYGASSNSKFAAFLRHPNFTSKIKGLYFCGGSVHPGGGIPLSLLSAKIVASLIPEES